MPWQSCRTHPAARPYLPPILMAVLLCGICTPLARSASNFSGGAGPSMTCMAALRCEVDLCTAAQRNAVHWEQHGVAPQLHSVSLDQEEGCTTRSCIDQVHGF